MPKLLLCFLLLPFGAWAQVVRGTVTDQGGRAVPYASVAVPAQRLGTTADAAGAFALPGLPAGPLVLEASAVGYAPARLAVTLPAARPLVIQLTKTENALADVVVTGVSRGTELRRSPIPIAAMSQRELRATASANVIDAAVRGIPGLSAVTTGPNVSKPFIRGLGYNRVLTLYNGLRQEGQQWGDEHGIEVDTYGVDRIEVVKGPASLLYGSDAVAGVVNLLPALPTGPEGELHGEALAEYQSVNALLGASAALNYQKHGLLTSFRASHRLARDYRNAADGLVYNTGFREATATGLLGVQKPWGSLHLWLTAYTNHQEIPDGSRDSLTRAFTYQTLEADRDDLKARPVVPEAALRAYAQSALRQHIRHYRAFADGAIKAGGGEVRFLLGVQQNHRQEFNHPTAPAQPGLDLRLTTTSYEARYLAPTYKGIELTVGANGMSQRNEHLHATDFPIPAYTLFDIGGFGVAKRAWGALEVTAGLRYDARTVRWPDFYVGTDAATGFGTAAHAATPGAALPFPAFGATYQGLSASVGGSYALGPHWVLRANVARGYRAPNLPEIGSNGLDPGAHIVYLGNRSFGPEFSLQQDLGLSWKSAAWEASAEVFHNYVAGFIYQARLYDAQGQPVAVVPGAATYQYQQAAARLYGTEVAFNLHPAALPWLSWRTGAALVVGLNDNPALRERVGAAGHYLPLIPAPQARTELRLSAPARPAARCTATFVRLALEGTAAQRRYYAVDGAETATPGYLLLGAGVGTTLHAAAGREAVQFFVQVDNLLDTAYQAHLNRLKYFEYYAASPTGQTGIYNPGRNISAKVVVPF